MPFIVNCCQSKWAAARLDRRRVEKDNTLPPEVFVVRCQTQPEREVFGAWPDAQVGPVPRLSIYIPYDQCRLKMAIAFQHLVGWDPVDTRGLHRDACDAMCSRELISTPAAPIFIISIAVGLLATKGRGLCKSVIFLTAITDKAASPLSSSHQPTDQRSPHKMKRSILTGID